MKKTSAFQMIALVAILFSLLFTYGFATTLSSDTDHDIDLDAAGTGVVNIDKLSFETSTISSNDTNYDITLSPNGTGKVKTDNLALDGNTISSTDSNGNIVLTPDGTGKVTTDNLAFDGNTISSTNANGDIILDPDATGGVDIANGRLISSGGPGGCVCVDDYFDVQGPATFNSSVTIGGAVGFEGVLAAPGMANAQADCLVYYNSATYSITYYDTGCPYVFYQIDGGSWINAGHVITNANGNIFNSVLKLSHVEKSVNLRIANLKDEIDYIDYVAFINKSTPDSGVVFMKEFPVDDKICSREDNTFRVLNKGEMLEYSFQGKGEISIKVVGYFVNDGNYSDGKTQEDVMKRRSIENLNRVN